MSYKLVESQPIVQRTSASVASRKTQRTPFVRPSTTSSRSCRSLVRCGRLAYHAISNFNSVRMSRYGTRGVFTSVFYAGAPTPAAAFEACSATSASMIIRGNLHSFHCRWIVLADANAFRLLRLRHITATDFPDTAAYLIADSLRADQIFSVWLVPFSSQYPIHTPMKSLR
jgi:hypothetical protein